MTEFDKLTVEDVEAIGAADDADAMDRNARAAAHLWSAYEYAKNSFGSHFTELRQHWNGAVAARFAQEAQIVHDDVNEMGTVLQAHTDALPVVAETMRRLKDDSKQLADEYRGKRAEFEKQPPEQALPQIQKLDQEYGEKSRARLIEANNTYHQYNNGYLAPPKEFRGVLPDNAQPQLQGSPSLPSVPPPTAPSVAPPSTVAGTPPVPGPLPPMTVIPPRPLVAPPPMAPRSLVGTPGLGIVRNPPAAMPRTTMVAPPSATPRAVPRTGVASTIPAHPRPAVVRPVTTVTGPRPGVMGRPGMAVRPPIPPRTLTSPLVTAGRATPQARATTVVPEGARTYQWTRSPVVRAATVPSVTPKPPAPATPPTPQWTRTPVVVAVEPAAVAPPETPTRPSAPQWGRTPWVRPAEGSAVYPSRIDPPAEEPETEPSPAEADEPLLNPITLSRLLAEATPAERERLLAVESAKLERIQAAARAEQPPAT